MARYLVYAKARGKFLVPGENGQPEWSEDFRLSGGGVVADYENAFQMAIEYGEIDDEIQIVDLDKLGTKNDYTG